MIDLPPCFIQKPYHKVSPFLALTNHICYFRKSFCQNFSNFCRSVCELKSFCSSSYDSTRHSNLS
nr:MAG TPA: hypothetical protein [Caudoviricetes sp.]